MLSDANAKVYQVAESVGYNNYNYFSKMFKKFEGVSPSEYAAQAQV
jgi:two-component system response regulator YesN